MRRLSAVLLCAALVSSALVITTPAPATAQTAASMFAFLEGYKNVQAGNYDQAIEYYKVALKQDPGSAAIRGELALIYVKKNEFDKARAFLEEALRIDPKDGNHLKLLADIYLSKNELDQARKLYERCIELDDHDTVAYILLASVYIGQKKYREAAATYEKVLAYDDDNVDALVYSAKLYREMREFDRSRKRYEKLLQMRPDSEAVLFDLGTLSEMEGKLDMAAGYYARILKRNPANKNARARMAAVYTQKKDMDNAILELEKLSDLDRNDLSVRENIGLLLLDKGRFEEAIREFTLILASKPEYDKGHLYLAIALEGSGRYKQALDELLKMDPKGREFLSAVRSLPSLYVKTNSTDEGIGRIQKLLEKDGANANLHLVLSALYEEKADYANAIATLEKARTASPQNTELLYQLGMTLEKSGNRDAAMARMEELLKLDPENPGALNFIGYSYAERGVNLDRAEEMVRKALEKRPDDGYIRDSLAWVLYGKGQYTKALEEILKAQELVTDDSTITEHLSDIYVKMGQHDKALESLKKSIDIEKKEDRKKALEEKLKGLQKHR